LQRTRPCPRALSGQRNTCSLLMALPGTGNKGVTSTAVPKK
jgi:hypothetical protein